MTAPSSIFSSSFSSSFRLNLLRFVFSTFTINLIHNLLSLFVAFKFEEKEEIEKWPRTSHICSTCTTCILAIFCIFCLIMILTLICNVESWGNHLRFCLHKVFLLWNTKKESKTNLDLKDNLREKKFDWWLKAKIINTFASVQVYMCTKFWSSNRF